MHLPFEVTNRMPLRLDGVAHGLESELYDILDVLPLVFALQELKHKRRRIRIALTQIWILVFAASSFCALHISPGGCLNISTSAAVHAFLAFERLKVPIVWVPVLVCQVNICGFRLDSGKGRSDAVANGFIAVKDVTRRGAGPLVVSFVGNGSLLVVFNGTRRVFRVSENGALVMRSHARVGAQHFIVILVSLSEVVVAACVVTAVDENASWWDSVVSVAACI